MTAGRRPHPLVLAASGVALAAVASLALRAGAQHDALGWVIWGREILHGALDTRWFPSWKPLPVLVTTPAAIAGGAAPTIWLIAARFGAIAGLALAGWLAARVAGWVAAVLVVIAIPLMPGWLEYALAGLIEPIVLALMLGALACALAGRQRWTLVLLALAALGRVEAWGLLALAAAWSFHLRRDRVLACALLAAVPAAWLGGDWLGSGDPTHGGQLAKAAGDAVAAARSGSGAAALAPALVHLVTLPGLLLAIAAVALGVRARSRLEPALAVAVCVWIAIDVVLVSTGYAPSPRFLLPAGALVTVLAAIGLLRGLRELRVPAPATAAVAAACAAAVVVVHASTARAQIDHAAWFKRTALSLDTAVRRTGGAGAIRACGGAGTLEPFRTRLAWDVDAPTSAVHGRPHRVGIVFALNDVGTPAPWRPGATRRAHRWLGRVGPWVVMSAPHATARASCRSALAASGFRRVRGGNA